MQIIETNVPDEARRCRLVQFGGKARKIKIGGTCYTGIVHSVRQVTSRNRSVWIIAFIPEEQKHATLLGPNDRESSGPTAARRNIATNVHASV